MILFRFNFFLITINCIYVRMKISMKNVLDKTLKIKCMQDLKYSEEKFPTRCEEFMFRMRRILRNYV